MAKKPVIQPTFYPVEHLAPQGSPSSRSAKKQNKNSNAKTALIVGGVLAAILFSVGLLVGTSLYFKSVESSYKKAYVDPLEVSHEVVGEAKNQPMPKVDTLINPAIKREILEGKGLEVSLISTYQGKEDEKEMFTIEPWEKYEETSPAQRQKFVETKLAELQSKIDKLATYSPKNWNFVVILDNTESVDANLQGKFAKVFDELLLDERVKQGDGVTVHFAKLTATDLTQDAPKVVIPKGAGSLNAYQEELNSARNWLLQKTSGSQTSSVYPGLLNLLSEYAKRDRTRIVILSDMMENDPNPDTGSGVTFYKPDGGQKLLMDKSQWPQLDEKILNRLSKQDKDGKLVPPSLAGLSIKIYAPPSVIKIAKVAKEAQNYSQYLLTKLGATVETKW